MFTNFSDNVLNKTASTDFKISMRHSIAALPTPTPDA